ncbi:hypothetical protein D3C73_1595550 [compost metagenome]
MFRSWLPVLSVKPNTLTAVLLYSFSTIATPVRVLAPAGFRLALLLSKVTLLGIFRMMLSPLRVTLTPVPCIFSRSFASCTSM